MTISVDKFIKYCKDEKIEVKHAFDIGAEDARDAVEFQKAFQDANIWALEGNPDTYTKYSSDFKESDIKYINVAISNKNLASVPFYKKTISGISGLRNRGSCYSGEKTMVEVSRFDTFCKQNSIHQADLVKIDVEGCAYEVLKGFGNILSTVQIFHLETEQTQLFEGQVTEDEVFKFMTARGFYMIEQSLCCDTQYDSIWRKK